MDRIACAAIRNKEGIIICSARHFDTIMHGQIESSFHDWKNVDQGFINQRGEYLTREEAWVIATTAKQIIQRCGGDEEKLFSENLY